MDRSTRQRDAIRGAFTPTGRPLTPKEIQEHADRQAPGISLATVYRTVKALRAEAEAPFESLPKWLLLLVVRIDYSCVYRN
ncbi:MAG: transcriptional repressor [Planctomycetota bacterium]